MARLAKRHVVGDGLVVTPGQGRGRPQPAGEVVGLQNLHDLLAGLHTGLPRALDDHVEAQQARQHRRPPAATRHQRGETVAVPGETSRPPVGRSDGRHWGGCRGRRHAPAPAAAPPDPGRRPPPPPSSTDRISHLTTGGWQRCSSGRSPGWPTPTAPEPGVGASCPSSRVKRPPAQDALHRGPVSPPEGSRSSVIRCNNAPATSEVGYSRVVGGAGRAGCSRWAR